MASFTNPARNDGLILRHWRRKRDPNVAVPPATPADSTSALEPNQETKVSETEPEYHFAKFNVRASGPVYSEEEYEAHLKSNTWSKEETDYLVDLAHDLDLRWIIVFDRYEYQPIKAPLEEDSMDIAIQHSSRTMEDMKARYYEVAAKIMALRHPLSSMSTSEFELHEKMTKFDPALEATRKKLAEALLSRSPEEIREEEILLGELKRIIANEERFTRERKELYARLEAPHSSGNTAMYQSSQGLQQLLNTLVSADKNKKRRLANGDAPSSPGPPNSSSQADRSNHRDSLPGSSSYKKLPPSSSTPTNRRQLSLKEETKFGIAHHERLTSGIHFRHERITKLAQAKSNVQASKIGAALAELQIPLRLVMPTSKVCAEYERLIGGIHKLLDVRKVREKLDGEIKVLRAAKEEREGGGGGERQDGDGEVAKAEEEEDEEEGEGEEDAEGEAEDDGAGEDEEEEEEEEDDDDDDDEDEDGEAEREADAEEKAAEAERAASVAASARSARSARQKRSASVLSLGSEKSSKRQRK